MKLLDVHELVAGYGEVQILRGASLGLEAGKMTALVGSNGVGKTTLLRTVMGLIRPWSGTVTFAGRDITRVSTHEKAAAGLVLVPEGRQLFTDMTVLENLNLGAVSRRAAAHRTSNLQRVYELFPWLEARGGQRAGTLSGGEQQMLAVGRGLMEEPEVLMFDELSLGLAPATLLTLMAALRQLKTAELTMLLVEQNVRMALAVSDYAYVLREGAVWREGPAREVARMAEIQEAYLGA